MIRNQGFENSLRCLQHPLSLLSIALLLLNDHVFKVVSPSWLTGKLSDFAGLFFFPFIVASISSLFLTKFNIKSRQLGQIAFGCVAIWFILIKTFQPINYLTSQFSSYVIGSPTYFTLDWTDLVGLSVILPAWKLWNQTRKWQPKKIAYIALSIGIFASIATSPRAYEVTTVTNLEYYNGVVFAADRDGWGENSYPVAKSLDGGVTWEPANDINNIEEKGLPIKHCGHINPAICYQITTSGRIQELKVFNEEDTWMNVSGLESIHVYDLILFEWQDKEYIIVAIGEYGTWRRELPNGKWDEISVLYANK